MIRSLSTFQLKAQPIERCQNSNTEIHMTHIMENTIFP